MTLHGPSSEPFDEPKIPILMTDWGHNSAFNAITSGLSNASILLNGVGNITRYNNSFKAPLKIPDPYTLNFEAPAKGSRAKRYLLRLINTSFESTFIFSIDGHKLQVIEVDFVPIKTYNTTSILVGIGQRYHVIVTADDPLPDAEAYWIRTWKANCFGFDQTDASPGYEKTGIVRYDYSEAIPSTTAWDNVPFACSDEPYENLQPILKWTVGNPVNDPAGSVGENFTVQFKGGQSSIFPLAKFSMGGQDFNPLAIDYSNPTFLNLDYTGKWNPLWVVIPENYKSTDWVSLRFKRSVNPFWDN